MPSKKIALHPVAPFDFNLSAQIFSDGDRQIRTYEDGKFMQVLTVNGKLMLVALKSTGGVEEPKLEAELKSNTAISQADQKKAVEKITFLFNLDFDPLPYYEQIQHDKIMKGITAKLRGLRSPLTQTVFEALVDSIVEQQISLRIANLFEQRIIRQFGETLKIDNEVYYEYPTPQALGSASIETLRSFGLSQRKGEYITEISKQVADGRLELENFKNYPTADQIIEELDKVRGIGVWTAELTIARSMQKWEVMPADDLGLRRIISHYYRKDKKISSAEARQIAEPWGMWKGLAAYYLVVADMLGLEP